MPRELHEKESYSNQFGEHKSQEQERYAQKALNRHGTGDADDPLADLTTAGSRFMQSITPSDDGPFGDIEQAWETVSGPSGHSGGPAMDATPQTFSPGVRPVQPSGIASHNGRHLNGRDIFGSEK